VVSKWYEDTYKNGKLKIIVLNQEKNAKNNYFKRTIFCVLK